MLAFLAVLALMAAGWFGFGALGIKLGRRLQRDGTAQNAEMPFFVIFGALGVCLAMGLLALFVRR